MNFANITHILKCPSGVYVACGSVPATMMDLVTPPSRYAIMAGRTFTDSNGTTWEHKQKVFKTVGEFLACASAHNVNLCSLEGCACRREFDKCPTCEGSQTIYDGRTDSDRECPACCAVGYVETERTSEK